jgi:uncharacterized Zn-finger protein
VRSNRAGCTIYSAPIPAILPPMSEAIIPHNTETVTTPHKRVACDGPVFSKHPRVYLTMVDDTAGNPVSVVCPYCSRVFLYAAEEGAAEAH